MSNEIIVKQLKSGNFCPKCNCTNKQRLNQISYTYQAIAQEPSLERWCSECIQQFCVIQDGIVIGFKKGD